MPRRRTHEGRKVVMTIQKRVPCTLSRTGSHDFKFTITKDRRIVYMGCPCEHVDAETLDTLLRTGHPTCRQIMMLVRDRISNFVKEDGSWSDQWRGDLPKTDDAAQTILQQSYNVAREAHRKRKTTETSHRDYLAELLTERLKRRSLTAFMVSWNEEKEHYYVRLRHYKNVSLPLVICTKGNWMYLEDNIRQSIGEPRTWKNDWSRRKSSYAKAGQCFICSCKVGDIGSHMKTQRHAKAFRRMLDEAVQVLSTKSLSLRGRSSR